MGQVPLIAGFTIMSLSTLLIYLSGRKKVAIKNHVMMHAMVTFIAATAYLAMALGVGNVMSDNGTTIYFARYIDWSVTTPILLAGLVMIAFHEYGPSSQISGYLTAIIGLDIIMVITGLLSSLADAFMLKAIWYLWSCVAFLGVLFLLWRPLRKIAATRELTTAGGYYKNITLLTLVWLIYPVVFLLGPEGLGVISDAASVWSFLVLDVIAKVFYAFYAARVLVKSFQTSTIDNTTV
ncbi:bacteriorhodopsin [Tatumella ptyseos]|uniref:bacteriorhodopsin n=1 Tax=Tatumella ptyseos TaxID=82987 RepID=UPI0026EAFF9B|nr:bacteriorhodopsin [Tatumella ptyseos]WKX27227.1 bacteriorhodopsin [Tatumella ptyseos]